jgi:hypothetical protein
MSKMKKQAFVCLVAFSVAITSLASEVASDKSYPRMPDVSGIYPEFVTLFDEIHEWLMSQRSRSGRLTIITEGRATYEHPDFGNAARKLDHPMPYSVLPESYAFFLERRKI